MKMRDEIKRGPSRYLTFEHLPFRDKPKVHLIELAFEESYWSRNVRSITHFKSRENIKAFGDHERQVATNRGLIRWTGVTYIGPIEEITHKEYLDDPKLLKHDNIHDFYHSVAYDLRSKKYTDYRHASDYLFLLSRNIVYSELDKHWVNKPNISDKVMDQLDQFFLACDKDERKMIEQVMSRLQSGVFIKKDMQVVARNLK